MFRPRRVMRRRLVARAPLIGGIVYYAPEPAAQSGPEEQPTPARSSAPSGSAVDAIEQLRELGELREQGILTVEEFVAEKRKVLES